MQDRFTPNEYAVLAECVGLTLKVRDALAPMPGPDVSPILRDLYTRLEAAAAPTHAPGELLAPQQEGPA